MKRSSRGGRCAGRHPSDASRPKGYILGMFPYPRYPSKRLSSLAPRMEFFIEFLESPMNMLLRRHGFVFELCIRIMDGSAVSVSPPVLKLLEFIMSFSSVVLALQLHAMV